MVAWKPNIILFSYLWVIFIICKRETSFVVALVVIIVWKFKYRRRPWVGMLDFSGHLLQLEFPHILWTFFLMKDLSTLNTSWCYSFPTSFEDRTQEDNWGTQSDIPIYSFNSEQNNVRKQGSLGTYDLVRFRGSNNWRSALSSGGSGLQVAWTQVAQCYQEHIIQAGLSVFMESLDLINISLKNPSSWTR